MLFFRAFVVKKFRFKPFKTIEVIKEVKTHILFEKTAKLCYTVKR